MEETVGRWWHQWLEHLTRPEFEAHQVCLQDVAKRVGVLFRAAGGAAGVRIAPSSEQGTGGHRRWLQRLAGSHRRHALAQIEPWVLSLPATVCVLPQERLNRDLYAWWALLAAHYTHSGDWMADNMAATRRALEQFPGFEARYQSLREALLVQRAPAGQLKGLAAQQEAQVQAALSTTRPAQAATHSVAVRPQDVAPVWLWLVPATQDWPATGGPPREAQKPDEVRTPQGAADMRKRRRVQRQATDHSRPALVLPFRAESLMSWTEMVRLDRSSDDEDDGQADKAANDMDTLSLAQGDGQTLASRVKFDLDLPSHSEDEVDLGPGLKFPEWDYRRRVLLADHCLVQEKVAQAQEPFRAPPALRRTARQLRRRLEVLRAAPRWVGAQPSGDELDLDAWVRLQSDSLGPHGSQVESPAVFRRQSRTERSMATLLLADLSQSTDAYANDHARVIDVIRDALFVLGEGMSTVGDPFAMWGFSSVRRQHVRLHLIKQFDEPWRDPVLARVGALRPGYYTRMGAALRHATAQLGQRGERKRLLMLLTDGKPNDLDVYEGRYGLEDTRQAVHEARVAGLVPFCVTIDAAAHDYLPMLFGQRGFCLVHRPQDLVQRLTQAWSLLAR